MFDFIGDIHGHANKLKALLSKLNYQPRNGSYSHPDNRKVIFVGDYIDRGPEIRETLRIVRSMVDNDDALAIMGNHEFNALCYHMKDKNGNPLREHSPKNEKQHKKTLEEFANRSEEWNSYLNWFKTLPLFYEDPEFRVVHACWDNNNIKNLMDKLQNGRLNDDLIHQSVQKGTDFYWAIEETLKGKEIKMPTGTSFTDKDDHTRHEIRIKWWCNPQATSYRNLSIIPLDNLPDTQVPKDLLKNEDYYQDPKPVFFGHYWLTGRPVIHESNICCLDFSVAKGGHLASYRFDGETELGEGKLFYV